MSNAKQNTITMKNNYYMDEMAISPVIGIILMVASIIVISGTIIVMLGGFAPPDIPPYAIISVSDAEGGTQPDVNLENNSIRILHRSGDMLCINETMVVMQGCGQTRLAGGGGTGWFRRQDIYPIRVIYKHIHSKGKYNPPYRNRNSNLFADRYWSAGEILDLNGHDSKNIQRPNSTVTVIRLDNSSTTSDNWQFKANSKVNLLIIDISSNQVISSTTFTMRQFT